MPRCYAACVGRRECAPGWPAHVAHVLTCPAWHTPSCRCCMPVLLPHELSMKITESTQLRPMSMHLTCSKSLTVKCLECTSGLLNSTEQLRAPLVGCVCHKLADRSTLAKCTRHVLLLRVRTGACRRAVCAPAVASTVAGAKL